MKFKTAFTLVALASVGVSASATTTDWGDLAPAPFTSVAVAHPAAGTFDDFYTFTLTSASDVALYDKAFEADDSGINGGTVTLFSGSVGSGTMVGAANALTDPATTFTYSDEAAGSYYFEVTGTAVGVDGTYDIHASANPPGGPSAVPEPANAALLLAGLGMMSIVFRRRKPR